MRLSGMLRYRARRLVFIGWLAGSTLVAAAAEAAPVQCEAGPDGELSLRARGATTEEALQALAAEAGFEVVIAGELPQRKTDLTLSPAPLERVLHEILRGRNYALLYDGESDAVRRVIVLPPGSKGAAPPPRRAAAKARGGRPAGPLVVRSTAHGAAAAAQKAPAKRKPGKPAGALVIRQ